MPFTKLTDLPTQVKDVLPKHAEEIFLAAFNSAWEQYDLPEERQGDDTREETAFKVAWAAVKRKYEKNEETGMWVKKDD
ncbi:MAG TPA: ChaB family protein [Vitreimonas sp.]|nr:ChaB family protein [Vitreimonas sp.]